VGNQAVHQRHEWPKRQLEKRGIGYEALDNGFLSCAEPKKLQQICDSLRPEQIERLFQKWLKRIRLPLRGEDRKAGYDWDHQPIITVIMLIQFGGTFLIQQF
jgi:hypothetical protein